MNRPHLIVIMGVTGSGKSTVAREVARRRGWYCVDADDFHSPQARQHMSRGLPLSEAMRDPWIQALRAHLRQLSASGRHCVLAFSGLRKRHRQPLRETGFEVIFVLLKVDPAVLRERLQLRQGHFAPVELLDSQLATLESPAEEADVFTVDATLPLQQVLEQVAERLAGLDVPPAGAGC